MIAVLDQRTLGKDGPSLSAVGLGTWALGGPGWRFSWGPQDDDLSIRTIQHALELGYSWLDTAPVYGLGHSEEVVGRALAGRREQAFVATKCVNRWRDDGEIYQSGDPAGVREECEASLRRLGLDHIDLYQIHTPVPDTPVEETWAELCRLQDEGKVRYIGVSNFDVEQLRRCAEIRPVQSLQPPYHLLHRDVEEEILPYCLEHGIGVVPYGAMAEGLLSGSFDPARLRGDDFRRGEAFLALVPRANAIVAALRPLADERGWTVGQLCVAWAMQHPAVTSVIVGARSVEQAEQNVIPASADRSTVRADVEAALSGLDVA